MSKILPNEKHQTQRHENRWYAIAFGLLAATVGILAGGPSVWMVALGALFAALYLAAEHQGWLLKTSKDTLIRDRAVTAVFAALVALFVYLTGGRHSPMPCALYLPVLLASLCYGMRLGLTTSLVMIPTAAVFALDGHLPQSAPSMQAVAIGISFPVVALFGGALRAQMENRLHTLDSEKKDLSALLDMSQMMDSAFDLDMTLNLILLNVQQHSDCHVCAVYLKSADGRSLELRAASGALTPLVLLPMLTVDEARGTDWSLVETYQSDLSVHAFYAPETGESEIRGLSRLFAVDPSAQSFACLPLASADALLGMLYVGYAQPDALTAEGVHRLEHLASRAAFPLQRLLLQQDFRSLAYSDSMTGLDNFRQFEENMSDEIARAERYDRPLSVILLDIDHFKSFNDTLGHQAGDALLGQLGIVLRNSLRNVDKPARYGGEEFVIICPETGPEETLLIAERIRRNVAETAFLLPNKEGDSKEGGVRGQENARGGETAHVTISLGCATFPQDARTSRDLVKKADIALYAAKASGRNAVRTFEKKEALTKVA